jgi:hypothetical protein
VTLCVLRFQSKHCLCSQDMSQREVQSLEHLAPQNQRPSHASEIPESSKPYQKICAKLRSGVRFGIGFVLERSCGEDCLKCSGTAFQRHCRHFDFRPHYEVTLEKKRRTPLMKVNDFVLKISCSTNRETGTRGFLQFLPVGFYSSLHFIDLFNKNCGPSQAPPPSVQ